MDKDYDKIITDLVYDKITSLPKKDFIPGETYIPPSGIIRDAEGYMAMVKAVLEGIWTENRYGAAFGNSIRNFVGVRYPILVNSGSSANLLAVTALFDKKRPKWISCAVGFPTTINPVLQNGGELLLVDADLANFNAKTNQVLSLLDDPEVGGVIMAHTLGFPFDAEEIWEKCVEKDIPLIADNCDSLGTEVYHYGLDDWIQVGRIGTCSTYSFYPAHHISSVEGGAILTDNEPLARKIRSLRDWGKDCFCLPGTDNMCGKRFSQKFDGLPEGYDHKYIYTQIGYNLKMTDIQAALGYSQILILPDIIDKRHTNYTNLYHDLEEIILNDYIDVPYPDVGISPFGFPITVKQIFGNTTREFIQHLEDHKIATRPVFAGNLIRQPAYANREDISAPFGTRIADYVMKNSFWIGCHPNITDEMITYMGNTIKEYWND